jgi:hypothetical protein
MGSCFETSLKSSKVAMNVPKYSVDLGNVVEIKTNFEKLGRKHKSVKLQCRRGE